MQKLFCLMCSLVLFASMTLSVQAAALPADKTATRTEASKLALFPQGKTLLGPMHLTSCKINNTYQNIGIVELHNASDIPQDLSYWQLAKKTTRWDVSPLVAAKGEISKQFLAEIQKAIKVAVGESTTQEKSDTAGCTISVPPGQTGYIEAYHKSVYAEAYVNIKIYSGVHGEQLLWDRTERIYGNVIMQSSIHYLGYAV